MKKEKTYDVYFAGINLILSHFLLTNKASVWGGLSMCSGSLVLMSIAESKYIIIIDLYMCKIIH